MSMTDDALRETMIDALLEVAPEIERDEVPGGDLDLRHELDLDSMDILNYAIALHERLQIEIPEAEVPRLLTMAGGLAYLRDRLG